jgi:hypothetical protein
MRNGLLVLLLATAMVFPEKSEQGIANKNFGLGISCDFLRFSLGKPVFVSNVPYDFRNVPVHPDDSVFQKNAGPIERQRYEPYSYYELGLSLYCTFKIWIPVEVSFGLCFPFADDMAERNYTNDVGGVDRSKDAALTYCRVFITGTSPLLGLELPRLVPIYNSGHESLIIGLGCDLSYQTLAIDNGWDRFSSYQVYQEETLAHLFPFHAYVKSSFALGSDHFFWNLVMKTGATLNNFYSLTAAGKEMGVGTKSVSWFFSLTILDFAYYFF